MSFHATPAVPDRCPRCWALVLAAWAAGLAWLVDLQPVARPGEISAVREHLATFLLRRGYLEYRTDEQIAAERDSAPILVEHKCARPIVPAHRDMRNPPTVIDIITEGIPF